MMVIKSKNKKTDVLLDATKAEPIIQSISRAAAVLNCISDGVNSVTGIATKCNLSKSTTHRILQALTESEFVMQDPISHQYFLGYFIIKLISGPATIQEYLIASSGEEMEHLSEITGETISLGIKMGLKNIGVHLVPSKSDLKVINSNREFKPIYDGIDGKVLLSQLDNKSLLTTLTEIRQESISMHKSINTEELMSEINLIRQRGYAISYNEDTVGVIHISAPIKNYVLPSVLNLSGPEFRMNHKIEDLIKKLIESAERISNNLTKWPALKPYVARRLM